jgi:hypothetical protein
MSLSCQNLFLAAGLTIAVAADGQSSIDELAGKFVRYVRADRKEKLAVITDKSYYTAGENIWLKAWCLDSLSNQFIFLSKTLFVDLVDDKDSVVSQLLLNIPARKTAGKILLPARLGEGYYWLRAYTTRILKEDSNRIFVKPIFVVNPGKPNPRALGAYAMQSTAVAVDTSAPTILFYPEGGAIISGTTATIAFRSRSASGQPVDIAGYITDTSNDTVTRFSSARGMGKFSFDAYNPQKYTAHIHWNSRDLGYPLPGIDQFAMQLTIVGQDEQMLKMQVSLGDSIYKKNKRTRILGMSRDSLCFAAEGTDMYLVNVPLTDFPLGRTCFFLFDDRGNLVSQRSVYIRSGDSGRIVAATDKTIYSPGDRVNLRIGVKTANNSPAVATILSVAVTDDRLTGDQGNAEDGLDRLPVPEDGQYLDYTPAALDALMMTESPLYTDWRKLTPGMSTQATVRFADSTLLYIRGKATDKKNAPLHGYIVNLVGADKGLFLADTIDKYGRFQFPLSEYDDGAEFNMKLTNIEGDAAEGKLLLDNVDFPQFRTPPVLKRGFSREELAMIRRYKQVQATAEQPVAVKEATMLKPVTVRGQIKLPPEDEAQRESPFSDVIGPEQFKMGGIDMAYNALLMIPGFTSNINRTISGRASSFLVLVDGVQINGAGGDLKTFFETTMVESEIEFIEVLKGPLTAIYGVQGGAGVILIHSKRHIQDVVQVNDEGLTTIHPKGYCNQPDVFAAGYDNKKKEANGALEATDVPTLYWNANLLTNDRGNAMVNFLTGHIQGTYSAAIVGITQGGEIVEKRIRIRCQ